MWAWYPSFNIVHKGDVGFGSFMYSCAFLNPKFSNRNLWKFASQPRFWNYKIKWTLYSLAEIFYADLLFSAPVITQRIQFSMIYICDGPNQREGHYTIQLFYLYSIIRSKVGFSSLFFFFGSGSQVTYLYCASLFLIPLLQRPTYSATTWLCLCFFLIIFSLRKIRL